jgi:hypothetical protein
VIGQPTRADLSANKGQKLSGDGATHMSTLLSPEEARIQAANEALKKLMMLALTAGVLTFFIYGTPWEQRLALAPYIGLVGGQAWNNRFPVALLSGLAVAAGDTVGRALATNSPDPWAYTLAHIPSVVSLTAAMLLSALLAWALALVLRPREIELAKREKQRRAGILGMLLRSAVAPSPSPLFQSTKDSYAVVLIHGTFASCPEESGSAWWQEGSESRSGIEALLDASVAATRRTVPFHWSGQNLESGRVQGADELLEHLLTLEARQTPYHLVCHSHGGSLAWEALKRGVLLETSVLRRKPNEAVGLKYLMSWTTVGTPFLRRTAVRYNRFVHLLLQAIAGIVFVATSLWGFYSVTGFKPLLISTNAKLVNAFVAPVVTALVLGWLLRLASNQEELRQLELEDKAGRRIAELYSSRWLGLWSPDDEAIAGLAASLHFGGELTPRMRPTALYFQSQIAPAPYLEPLRRFARGIFNHVFAPLADRVAWSILARNVQGNDRPSLRNSGVSPRPDDSMQDQVLPKDICEDIRADADAGISAILPHVRVALGQAAAGQGLGALQLLGSQSASALIHTGYFRNARVLDKIARHIADSQVAR